MFIFFKIADFSTFKTFVQLFFPFSSRTVRKLCRSSLEQASLVAAPAPMAAFAIVVVFRSAVQQVVTVSSPVEEAPLNSTASFALHSCYES